MTRTLTGPEPGITRDSIAVEWTLGGRRYRLIDTAGLRRRSRVAEDLEKLSAAASRRTLALAQVVLLVIDAGQGLERQDLALARLCAQEGRALVVVANKWDLVGDAARAGRRIADRLRRSLPQVKGIRVAALSALTGEGVAELGPAIEAVHALWNRRIETAPLNRWLAEVEARHPPPLVRGRRVRLKYITQAKARPPTFALFTSRPGALADSYVRFLENDLRKTFALPGVPLRIVLRRGRNPYSSQP